MYKIQPLKASFEFQIHRFDLKLHSEKRPETNKENDKKSQLFGAEETPIKLQISGIKIPREDRKHFIKV